MTGFTGDPQYAGLRMPNPGEELIEAAENLLRFGGNVSRRADLRQALERLPYSAPERQDITRPWRFTPPCLGIIARAAAISVADNDQYVRIKHLQQALQDAPKAVDNV